MPVPWAKIFSISAAVLVTKILVSGSMRVYSFSKLGRSDFSGAETFLTINERPVTTIMAPTISKESPRAGEAVLVF